MRIRIFLIQLIIMGCICLYSEVISLESYSGSLNSGESDSLTVMISASSLSFGIYNYEIKVTENGSFTHTIPVEVEVYPAYLAAPLNVEISISADQVDLSWEPVTGAEGYQIFRSVYPDSGFIQIGTTELTNFTDLNSSIKAFYKIIAYYTEIEVRRITND
jgi:hypothetical protein